MKGLLSSGAGNQNSYLLWFMEELFHVRVRRGGSEEIPLVQGKEQWRSFAGASVKEIPHAQGKRNPSKTVGVARGHQRADTLKP